MIAVVADGGDLLELDLGALLHGLIGHEIAELRAGDGDEAGEVLHAGRPGDLPAEGVLFDDEHGLSRASGIDGGREPRGAAADDDDIVQHVISFLKEWNVSAEWSS